MTDATFSRLAAALLLLICGCLVLLDQQRQRQVGDLRREWDALHARLNAAGFLSSIKVSTEQPSSPPPPDWTQPPPAAVPVSASPIDDALYANSNDDLDHLGRKQL